VKNFFLKSLKLFVVPAFLLCISLPAFAQKSLTQKTGTKSYKVSFAPDVWFNSTDGIRVGLRMKGKEPGTFKEGPHRLNVGVWFSTFLPKYPVSYYISFTEPIKAISKFNSEASVKLRSSIRTGYEKHTVSFKKRWQPGFNEKNYRTIAINFRAEKRFDDNYLFYPQIWQHKWLYIIGLNYSMTNGNPLGRYKLQSSTSINIAGHYDRFINTRFNAQQRVPLGSGFTFKGRLFIGLSSNNSAPEYLFSRSLEPYTRWQRLGTTRARGTIPTAWMHEGFIQIEGGADIRGYTSQDIKQLNQGKAPIYTSMGSVNAELTFPNPISQSMKKIPVIGGLFKLNSYLFFDSGTSLGLTNREEGRVLSDAGPGIKLSLNIPDYLGQSRGFAIRYDVPLWLSNPAKGEPEFKYRNLLGIGAIISF